MSVFEDLFTQAKKETVQEEILQKLEEIKQLMVPKVIYVPYPVYIERKPWWHCEPLDYSYPESFDCVDAMKYAFRNTYSVDYAEHVCLAGACVST